MSANTSPKNEEPGRRNALHLPRRAFVMLKWALAAGVLASLLFAHGCHGNEDHELFDVAARVSGE